MRYHRLRKAASFASEVVAATRRVTLTKTDNPPQWMTLEDVADYLKLSRSRLYDMAQSGEIPCSKVAGRWRFFRPEIDEWMLRQRPTQAERNEV